MSSPDPRPDYAAHLQAEIADFRAHQGKPSRGPFVGRQVLLLTTVGARSGQPRTVPLAYTVDGDRLIIVASKGGSPSHPAWYANLLAQPIVTVEIGAETYRARSEVAQGAEHERLYAQHADLHPTFHDYRNMTRRVIPVIALERLAEGVASS
ncbi:MAG: nitroreductase/quinone reductase family protein [Candidatus Limnocylindrales bacterium]